MKIMKKKIFLILFLPILILFLFSSIVKAQAILEPRSCSLGYGCPEGLSEIYSQAGEKCVTSYEEFKKDPVNNHFWVDDEEITTQGKADERARQFIHWVLTHPSIDNHPSIFTIWSNVRNVAYFFTLIVAAIFGLGLILNRRFNFSQKIEIWPQIFKLIGVLLFITFSAAIVLTLIQLSDILMKFFTETLGGKDIFNIYFSSSFDEKNYAAIFCKDLNYKVQEAIKTQVFLLQLTNITYYILGIMIILRKIILWFLIFVSPFLALLLPFIFIRNIGWIWIGVFFQWLFYGPLLGLFLYALKVLWQNGIPFPFDFSRVGTIAGYIFPTGTTILYGGPAQVLSVLNSVNYIDPYVEYIISLIMLWAAIFFPWWLLRIFRDYCCEGIYAAKNILISIYDQLRGGPSSTPSPLLTPVFTSTAMKIPKEMEIPVKIKLQKIEEIKKAKTEEISKSLNFHVVKLTDIAHIESNKQIFQQINQNLNYLKNPMSAETPTEKQRYLHLRTELSSRAVKQDQIAQRIVSTISTSKVEQTTQKQQLVKTLPQAIPITQALSFTTNLPAPKIQSITNNFTTNSSLHQVVAKKTNISQDSVQKTLTSFSQNINQHPLTVLQKVSEETRLPKEQIKTILKVFRETIKEKPELIEEVAKKEQVAKEKVQEVIEQPIITEPEKAPEQVFSIPPGVSIEEYEEVKKMWVNQYEKGEVPVSDNIKNREQWVGQDIIFITNTLNKLLSPDKELRQQGLDDVGYILPIFLINNLSGEQLITYLRAKLEAAKQVLGLIEKEKEITQKLKEKTTEELVEIPVEKKEEKTKAMEMEESMKIKEEDKPKMNN